MRFTGTCHTTGWGDCLGGNTEGKGQTTSRKNIHSRFVVQMGEFEHGEAAMEPWPESTSLESYGARVTSDGIKF